MVKYFRVDSESDAVENLISYFTNMFEKISKNKKTSLELLYYTIKQLCFMLEKLFIYCTMCMALVA